MGSLDHGFTPYRVDFRSKFLGELETWIEDRGFDDALTLFAGFLQKQIDEGATDAEIQSMQEAWEEAAGVVGPEPDYEAQAAERDRRAYEGGKAEAEMRRAERRIYGDDLAGQFHAQDDLNRYNRGDDE